MVGVLRRLAVIVGVMAVLVPVSGARADEESATIDVTAARATILQADCVSNANGKQEAGNGNWVLIESITMLGTFGVTNKYAGTVRFEEYLSACSVPNLDLPPPFGVIRWGHFAGGTQFSGGPVHPAVGGKCVRGRVLGGDFRTVGPTTFVKISLAFDLGDAPPGPPGEVCVVKKSVPRVDCAGSFKGLTLLSSLGIGNQDTFTGKVTCAQPGVVPSNV